MDSEEFTSEVEISVDVVSCHDFFTPPRLRRLVDYSNSMELSDGAVGPLFDVSAKGRCLLPNSRSANTVLEDFVAAYNGSCPHEVDSVTWPTYHVMAEG